MPLIACRMALCIITVAQCYANSKLMYIIGENKTTTCTQKVISCTSLFKPTRVNKCIMHSLYVFVWLEFGLA